MRCPFLGGALVDGGGLLIQSDSNQCALVQRAVMNCRSNSWESCTRVDEEKKAGVVAECISCLAVYDRTGSTGHSSVQFAYWLEHCKEVEHEFV